MKKAVLQFVVGLMIYVRSAINSETVWVKDVTTGLQTDKRILSDFDLPDVLTFTLSRGSHALNLNLKRNHEIDPNADVYIVQKLEDGRFHARKSGNLEHEDIAYYQDVENGAFMTVRCVRRSSGHCDRVINGNIRIDGRNYDLRQAETDVALRNFQESSNLLSTKYVLQDQEEVQRKIPLYKGVSASASRRNVEKEFLEQVQRLRRRQEKQNHHLLQDDHVRNLKKKYYVEMGILVDSSIYDLHSSLVEISNEAEKEVQVKANIREYFSHIINGVSLLYKSIEDDSMSITITLLEFFMYKRESDFPHIVSSVLRDAGKSYIEVLEYLKDLRKWDEDYSEFFVEYDHAMLFTRHDLYMGVPENNTAIGRAYDGNVCDLGKRVSIVQIEDYFHTVSTAAHELGHNLGADHDGEKRSVACPAEDMYIMSPKMPQFEKDKPFSRNPWFFSNCSVDLFKRTLRHKTCVFNIGGIYNETEWTKIMMKLPGEVYKPSHQCQLIKGPKSDFCGVVSEHICLFMKCKNPKTGICLLQRFIAARGTKCGHNKWCIDGQCVLKGDSSDTDTNDIDR